MKAIKLFAIAALTLGMMACNKKEDSNVIPNEGTQATLSIKVDAGSQLRALGASPADGDVKSLEVYVYAGDLLEGYKKVENTSEAVDINVTTGERKLVVVANANLGKINSLTELQEIALRDKVVMVEPSGDDQVGVAMTAEPQTITIKAGKNTYGFGAGEGSISSAPLQLVKVPARISLVGASTSFEGAFAGWTFEPSEVFVFNVPNSSRLFGPSLELVEMGRYAGMKQDSWTGDLWVPSQVVKEVLRDEVSDLSSITPNNFIYYHSFESIGKPVVLVIRGKLKDDSGQLVKGAPFADDNGYTHYSILVNAERSGYAYTGDDTGTGNLKRNTDYRISVVIKRPGTSDPTTPPADAATLDVKVAVTPWLTVNQNIEY